MVDGISPVVAQQLQQALQNAKVPEGVEKPEGAPAFGEVLNNLLNDVDQAQKVADESIQGLVTGESTSIQDVVLKMEEADLAFGMMKEIRDKLLSAYKEIMSMQA